MREAGIRPTFACRHEGCTRRFVNQQGRARHESAKHGMRFGLPVETMQENVGAEEAQPIVVTQEKAFERPPWTPLEHLREALKINEARQKEIGERLLELRRLEEEQKALDADRVVLEDALQRLEKNWDAAHQEKAAVMNAQE